jgi:HAD superfamily hydrolase (TIGR01509 family)
VRLDHRDFTALFFDDGGVLNDNAARGPQWQRLVGEYLAPRLGGTAAAWGQANRLVMERMEAPSEVARQRTRCPDARDYERIRLSAWFGAMIAEVGVARPSAESVLTLALETTAFVTRHIRAAFPDVVATLAALAARGYALHTASNEASHELAGYLEGMSVRSYFDRLYGPDLVRTHKTSPLYYQRILTECALHPSQALIIDDNPQAIAYATQAGAQALLVDRSARALVSPSPTTIGNLTSLLTLLHE